MKSAVLPAEITTVEDKLAANLTLKQVILMVIPVMTSGVIYFALPPMNRLVLYKVTLSCLILVFFLTLAIRINHKIILEWLIVTGKYFSRPRIYVYRKELDKEPSETEEFASSRENKKPEPVRQTKSDFDSSDLAKARLLIHNENLKMTFKTNKHGGINASVFKA